MRFLLLALLAAAPPALAAEPAAQPPSAAAPAAAPAPLLALRAARLFDARRGKLVTPGLVVVQGERIVQVGGEPPAGARVVDLGDQTLLPGLIDAHTHLTSEMGQSWYRDTMDGILRFPAEQVQYAAEYARRTLDAGFTAVRDLGASEYEDVALAHAIDEGIIPGPRMKFAVHAIGGTAGHADLDPFPPDRVPPYGVREGICNGADECRAAVRWQIKYGATVIKFMPSGGVLSLADPVDVPELSQAEMDAIVQEAHAWKRKAAAHCHGDRAAKMAIAAGVDSIEHGTFLETATLQEMKKRGVFLMPGPVNAPGPVPASAAAQFPPAIYEKLKAANAAQPQMIREALRLGVRIAFGTDAGVGKHGSNAAQLGYLAALGMPAAQALQSATLVDAELLGLEAGALEKGLLADIIAVPGNPLEDLGVTSKVSFVMKGGQIFRQGPPPPPAPKRLLLRAAHLFDGTAFADGSSVLIEGDRIAAVGKDLVAGDAQVIDLGEATLLPGLIDAHVHITGESQEDYAKAFTEGLFRFPAEDALRARTYAKRTLDAGFTTVRVLGAHGHTDASLRNAIDKGLAAGPRLLVAGDGIGSRGGHADSSPAPIEHLVPRNVTNGVCSGADQCREAVRWQLKYGADVIKFMVSGGVLSLNDPVDVPQLTPDEAFAIVDEAHAWHRKAAAHCHGDAAAKIAIAAGVDSIEHGSFLKPDTLAEMKRRGVSLVPTLMALESVERRANEKKLPEVIAEKALAAASSMHVMFKSAVDQGVDIVLGTDSGVSRHGLNAHEVTLMVKDGLSPALALQAGTSRAARLLGLSAKVGALEAGKLADVIAAPGNLAVDPSGVERVSLVIQNGKIVKGPIDARAPGLESARP